MASWTEYAGPMGDEPAPVEEEPSFKALILAKYPGARAAYNDRRAVRTSYTLRLWRGHAGGRRPRRPRRADRVLTWGESDLRARARDAPRRRGVALAPALPIALARRGGSVLRYELIRGRRRSRSSRADWTHILLEQAIDLDPHAVILDARRPGVDFAPSGVALRTDPRRGIRCLIAGALEVTVGDAPVRRWRRAWAWFESGASPCWRARRRGRAENELRSRRDPPARDPRAHVHPVRRTRRTRAGPTRSVHGVGRRADQIG